MSASTGRLDWLLVEFTREVPGVVNAVVVSGDGLRLAASPGVGEALGDQLSAAASGLVSLANGTAQLLGSGAVSQTILEMEGGYLFVTAVSRGATLAVHAERACDIGMIGYEMTLLASRVGHALTPAPHPGRSLVPADDAEVPAPRRAGRVVPVYAVTGGRTRSAGKELPVEALVTVTHSGRHAADLQLEYRTILGLAAAPVSLVEIGAHLSVPVGVARVLVGDLADAGYVAVHLPQVGGDGTPGPEILERLLEGLRARSA